MKHINADMLQFGRQPSLIRDIFEYGIRRKKEIGEDRVFDFSLGNPSIPVPEKVDRTIIDLIGTEDSVVLHGYTSGNGDAEVRRKIAENIKDRYGFDAEAKDVYMTCGAAASLAVSLRAIIASEDEEVIVVAPFFPEYKVFAENAGARVVVVPADEKEFQIDFDAFAAALNEKTKAVIINSPNNPTGVILTPENAAELCRLLKDAEGRYGHPIYLLADEPYRALVYDSDTKVTYLPLLYDDTLVCYSFSKAMSLPGDRIGYILVSGHMQDHDDVYAAVCGAGRAMGYVCAPAMMQRVIAKCLDDVGDIEIYRTNRDLLYNNLTRLGFSCVHPDGAFYLFVKSPEPDAGKFMMAARKYELLLVPSDSFGCTGYIRIAYCVSTDMIRRSIPQFEKLAKEYGLC